MAHIGRRHRKATPDDFVPGLIHHFPSNLPPASALPELPDSDPVRSSVQDHVVKKHELGHKISQLYKNPSPKAISLVTKKCLSQRKPLPERYAKMKGASAAIRALIENTHRERLSTRAIPTSNLRRSISDDEDLDTPEPIPGTVHHGLYHSPSGNALLDLIDVEAERRGAEKEARGRIKGLVDSGQAVSDRPRVHRFWTRSHSSENEAANDDSGKEKNDTWYTTRRQSRILNGVKQRTLEVSDDSDSPTECSESASVSSVYMPERRSVK